MASTRIHPAFTVVAGLALALSAFAGPAAAQGNQADVTLNEKTSGGTTLVVDSATLPNGGFVAVHDASLSDGAVLKSVVGASGYLEAGEHTDVEVQLSEPLTEDATLVAMPHKDTNGDHVYSFVADNGKTDGPYTADGGAVTDSAEITISATVSAADQPTDGRHIVVNNVEMAEGGFVAIHDERLLDGKPLASVVGVSDYLSAGPHKNVRVSLTAAVSGNQTLIPMPHEDSDDDKNYDFVASEGSEDPPYKNHKGKAVITQTKVSSSDTATATFEAQTTGGEQLYIKQAFLPNGGFVTIHDSSLASGKTFESVRGNTACLEPGLHNHIPVQLDDTLDSDDTLIAMPHKDTNNNCSYDFVSSDGNEDGPYTNEDGIVTDSGDAHVSAMTHYHGQESDGRTITVGTVDMANGGFLAVHTPALLAGQPLESVAGTSDYLKAGVHKDVKITLDPALRTSQMLIPMPHKDTNGNQKYDFVTSEGGSDGFYATSEGGPVIDTGYTTVRSQVTLEAQDATDSVTVASATLHNGGFVTLHDASLLDGKPLSSVVATSEKLSAGTHEDIELSIDDPPSGEVTLIAMPHLDTNDNDAYDFVKDKGKSDGPYTAGGGAVVHPNTVTFPTSTDDGGSTDGGTDGGVDGGSGSGGSDSGGSDDQQSTPGVGAAIAAAVVASSAVLVRRKN